MSDPLLTDCPACGAATYQKQLTAAGFQLKGSGWYVTDFRDGNKGGAAKKDGDAPAADAAGDKPASDKPAADQATADKTTADKAAPDKGAASATGSSPAPAPAPAAAPAAKPSAPSKAAPPASGS